MKIAHVVSTFPPRVGGMGQVCMEEVKRLAEAGHDVTVFTTRYTESTLDPQWKFKVVYLNSFLKTAAGAFVPQLFFLLHHFDIVHLHYPFYGGAEFVWLAKIFNKQKYIVTYHMDAQVYGPMKLLQMALDTLWSRLILSDAVKVIAVDKDHFTTTKFGKFVHPDKLVEIYNGADVEVFKPTVTRSSDAKTILFVGNLLPLKRFDLIIQALVKINNDNLSVTVVGGGYDINKYKKIAKDFGVADKIQFVGYCNDKEKLSEYYASTQCLVVPSDCEESFSLVTVEALACGCPVVVSDIPGVCGRIRDGETGFIFKSGSVEDLAEKIKKILLMSSEDRHSMKEKCRTEALEKYDWKIHCDKLIEVYKNFN